jgi:hypothetical protein
MAILSHHRTSCHANFATSPLGLWAAQAADLGRMTPGGRHIQKRTGLPAALANIYAEIHGLGRGATSMI